MALCVLPERRRKSGDTRLTPRTENKLGKDASTIVQYRHLEDLVSGWARELGIKYAKDITSYQLESWYASPE